MGGCGEPPHQGLSRSQVLGQVALGKADAQGLVSMGISVRQLLRPQCHRWETL